MDKYQINNSNSLEGHLKKTPFFFIIIVTIYLYVLFAPSRIKIAFSFIIEGKSTINLIWIIPLLCLIIFFTNKNRGELKKDHIFLNIYIFMYLLIIAVGGFYIDSISQYIYASCLFIFPMFLFFPMIKFKKEHIRTLIKFFVVVSLIYALLALILSTNYAFFMSLVGNNIYDQYYSQYRAPMMLGSSITVSYYFNLTLPLCFYMFFTSNEKRWRIVSALAILLLIIATFVLLSRMASLCAVLIIGFSLFSIKGSKKKQGSRKLGVIFIIVLATTYAYKNFDLTRIINSFGFSGSSAEARFEASNLGLYIFQKYPMWGSGIGKYFERIYDNKYITIDGLSGLIDPHNMYVLIMSELGLIGFGVTILLFGTLFKKFSNIEEKALRNTAYITLAAFLFGGFGGSHLLNEISFSSIFWIYIGMFYAVSIEDKNKKWVV